MINNVGIEDLTKLARVTQTMIVQNINLIDKNVKLGQCKHFFAKNYHSIEDKGVVLKMG